MRRAVALLFAVLAIAAPAHARDAVERLELSIREVTTDGRWVEGDVSGVYRFVVVDGADGRTARLHVQWLATPTGFPTGLVASAEILEISELKVDVADIEVDGRDDTRFVVRFEAIDPDGHGATPLELVATSPGRYSLLKSRRDRP